MKRINKLLKSLKKLNADGFLVSRGSNVTYLSNFTGDSSLLLVTPAGTVLLTDGRYTEQAASECHHGIQIIKWLNNERYGIRTYRHIAKELSIKRLGVEGHIITFSTFSMLKDGLKNTELVSMENTVEKQRQIKDQEEIDSIRTACRISVEALKKTVPYIKAGISEIELTARLEFNLKTSGAENISFDTIVLSGQRTSLLHGKPGNKKLEKGDFVLFDFGALYRGYHADISRTFILGRADNLQNELYGIIQKAQMSAILSIRPGISGRYADQKVRDNIPEKYISYYYPGMGHGVGLDIHEEPFLGRMYETTLQQNMVLTVEPGIYIPDRGGLRIEDTVLINKNSAEILTDFPRELIIL
ncbi:MAG: aminopeptidase P family protein [Bacteroidales bacterium]|nr:aminopeptidase P family protein [Bacteroidales bacterium]